jgi:hypothetical protein
MLRGSGVFGAKASEGASVSEHRVEKTAQTMVIIKVIAAFIDELSRR